MKFSKAQQKIQIQEEEEEEKETVSIFRLIVLGVLVVRQYDPFLYVSIIKEKEENLDLVGCCVSLYNLPE